MLLIEHSNIKWWLQFPIVLFVGDTDLVSSIRIGSETAVVYSHIYHFKCKFGMLFQLHNLANICLYPTVFKGVEIL